MSLLLGIVLFVVIGLCISFGALASYHSWIIFGRRVAGVARGRLRAQWRGASALTHTTCCH